MATVENSDDGKWAETFADASSHQFGARIRTSHFNIADLPLRTRYHKYAKKSDPWGYNPNFPALFSRNKLPSRI